MLHPAILSLAVLLSRVLLMSGVVVMLIAYVRRR